MNRTALCFSGVMLVASALRGAGPTALEIMQRAVEVDGAQSVARQHYIYREHQENRFIKADGSPGKVYIDRDFEVIFLEGEFYRKMVARDGKPLNPKQVQEEEAKLRMTAAERRAARAKRKGVYALSSGAPLQDVLRMMDHKLPGEETEDGRSYWVIESTLRKDVTAVTPGEKKALCYRYTFRVDRQQMMFAREEWVVVADGVDSRPGSWAKLELAEEPGAGIWLPRRVDYRTVPQKGPPFLQTQVFSDYRKFAAETTIQFEDGSK